MAAFKDTLDTFMTMSGTTGAKKAPTEPLKELVIEDSTTSPTMESDEDDQVFTLEYSEVTPNASKSSSSQYSLKRKNEQDSLDDMFGAKRIKVVKRNAAAAPSVEESPSDSYSTTKSRSLVVKRPHRLQIDHGSGSNTTGGELLLLLPSY